MYLELEPISYGLGRSFASIAFEGKRFICPYHRHPEFELVAIDSSSGRLVAGDYTGTFQAGDMFFLGENLPHIFQNSPLVTGARQRARSQVIQFRRDFAGAGLFAIPEFAPVQRLFHSSRRGLKISGTGRERIRERMRAIHGATPSRRVSQLIELLCDLATLRRARPMAGQAYDPSTIPIDGRMPGIMAHIQENFTSDLSVPEAARKAGLTPNAFCRYFKQQTRHTFTEVVNEMRIKEACRLLVETRASVTEIGYACGFGNLAHFHSEFRLRLRTSPLRFRKQHGDL